MEGRGLPSEDVVSLNCLQGDWYVCEIFLTPKDSAKGLLGVLSFCDSQDDIL